MNEISDAFLLAMAEVAASLIGLFLIGVFFYIEKGLRRWGQVRESFEPYLRAGTKITLIVFAIPTCLPLTLVALDLVWSRLLFALLSIMLLVANVESVSRVLSLTKVTRSTVLFLNEVATTVMAVLLIVLPWILGGLHPTKEDLTWAILLSFGAGFLSISSVVMSAFDHAENKPPAPTKTDNQE